MAMHCAWCNSAMLQAGVGDYQCLACGKKTNADGTQAQNLTYPDVHPQVLVEDATEPASQNPDRRYRPGDIVPGAELVPQDEPSVAPVPESPPTPAVVTEPEAVGAAPEVLSASAPQTDAPLVPAPVDLSTLSPEQVAAIELIAHPEV